MIYIFHHGDSEYFLTDAIRLNFRISFKCFPHKDCNKIKNKNSKNIQVNSLTRELNKANKKEHITPDDVIISIMDLDDCDNQQKTEYKAHSKRLFAPVISSSTIPIFNDPNLDTVLRQLGYDIPYHFNSKNEFYRDFFSKWTIDDFYTLREKCKNMKFTNLDELVTFFENQP